MEPAYIYIQIAQEIHEDRERILITDGTIYYQEMTTDEQAIYNQFKQMIQNMIEQSKS